MVVTLVRPVERERRPPPVAASDVSQSYISPMAVDPTWNRLEQPVLEAIAVMEDGGSLSIGSSNVASATSIGRDKVSLAVRRLVAAGYVAGTEYREGNESGPPDFIELRLLERGLRASGAWPPAVAP